MAFTKIFGWILLISGVATIVWSLYSSYNIFTDKMAMPAIFKAIGEKAPSNQEDKTSLTPADIQKEIEKAVGEQLSALMPADALPKILNLTAWTMLAGILIFGGSQIALIGIKLLIQ